METCQGCGELAQVDGKGRVLPHSSDIGQRYGLPTGTSASFTEAQLTAVRARVSCCRSGHPSREELARRKAARDAKRKAVVDACRPDAVVALDAYLEGRPEFSDRLHEFRRAALYEYNRVSRTRHRKAYTLEAHPGVDGWMVARCRFCHEKIGTVPGTPEVSSMAHSTLCSLLFLAGRLLGR